MRKMKKNVISTLTVALFVLLSCQDDVHVTSTVNSEVKVTVNDVKNQLESIIQYGGTFEAVNENSHDTLIIYKLNDGLYQGEHVSKLKLIAKENDQVKITLKPFEEHKDLKFTGVIAFSDGTMSALKDECSYTYNVPVYEDSIGVAFIVTADTQNNTPLIHAGGMFSIRHE